MNAKSIREELHEIPELGRHEFKTKEYLLNIARTLSASVYEPTPTGLVLYFNVGKKRTLCFRSDMDALPVTEANQVPYKSRHRGCMHACGHDGHMAMLMSFAIWANENTDKLTSNIVCLFQPSEEDDAGSRDILKSGILDELHIDEMYGFHIWPTLEEGVVYSMPLGMLATSGEVTVEIEGKSVHAANRRDGADSILAASDFMMEYYRYAETIDALHLISFGKIAGGTARNVVAGHTRIEATMRAFDDETFTAMKKKMSSIAEKMEEKYNVRFEIRINEAYPSVINSKELFDERKEELGLTMLSHPFMQAEDFGNYTRKYKCLFMLIGSGVNAPLLHTDRFDFNEEILEKGIAVYKKLATSAK